LYDNRPQFKEWQKDMEIMYTLKSTIQIIAP